MAKKEINLTWDGFYPEIKKDGNLVQTSKHKQSGIYAVYAGTRTTEGKCSIRKLLYIGESWNVVGDRLTDKHECYQDWKALLKPGEILYFSIADICKDDRERAEAALIYKTCPPCNKQCTESFNYDVTTIKSTGVIKFIESYFTVTK